MQPVAFPAEEEQLSAILVSACLIGVRCRYDGGDAFAPEVVKELEGKPFVPVCPEQLGGLPTPRPSAQIVGGDGTDVVQGSARVVTAEGGRDVTENFLRGARETLRIALLTGCSYAIMKSHSPSCGCGGIYHGERLVDGDGVTVALLKQHGLRIRSV